MGPEMVGTPHDVLETYRKRNVKEQQIKFFNNLHRKKKHKKKK